MAKCHFERIEAATQRTTSARPGFQSLIDSDLIARRKYTEMFRFAQHDIAIHEMIRGNSDCGLRIFD